MLLVSISAGQKLLSLTEVYEKLSLLEVLEFRRESRIELSQRMLLKTSSFWYHSRRKRYHLKISASFSVTIHGYQTR